MRIKSTIEENIKKNKLSYLIIFLFFTVGIVLGAYTIKYMNEFNKNELSTYFTNFTSSLGDRGIAYKSILVSSLKNNLSLFVIIGALGLFIFGFPFIPLISLWKGFSIGFTFSFLLTTYEYKGLALAITAVIPQNIFIIPALIFLGTICFSISFDKFKNKFTKNKKISLDKVNIGNILVVFSILLAIGIFIETFISPTVIKFIITKIYQ